MAGSNGVNAPHAAAAGINDLGQIVGPPGFVYTFGAFTLVPGAYGVNDTGDIVGYYADTSGINHSFLATPTNLNSPPPAGTTADVILRDGVTNVFGIWNIGNNSMLGGGTLGQVGPEWQFAGIGGFQAGDTSDMLLHNVNSGALEVYDISNNNITNATSLGTVGLDWQVAGFGNFSSVGETDMIMRNGTTGAFEVYDISNNQITDDPSLGVVGTEWQVAGFNNHGTETDMILRNAGTGALEVYATLLGTVGLEWHVAGFGNFSSQPGEGDMIMDNNGTLEVYDIRNNQVTSANVLGATGGYQIAGFGPFRSADNSDMLLRNSSTGYNIIFDIADNQMWFAGNMGQISSPLQIDGVAIDTPATSLTNNGVAAQLVQAMAGFGGGSGAAQSLNAAPLSTEPSQQQLLTIPHA